jgi:hypothetical protein
VTGYERFLDGGDHSKPWVAFSRRKALAVVAIPIADDSLLCERKEALVLLYEGNRRRRGQVDDVAFELRDDLDDVFTQELKREGNDPRFLEGPNDLLEILSANEAVVMPREEA